MTEAKRKIARYPTCFGKLDISGLCDVARNNGMEIIQAYKPSMHVCNEIALYGTSSAMKKTDAEWKANGHALKTARSGLPFGVDLNLPKEKWVDYVKKEET